MKHEAGFGVRDGMKSGGVAAFHGNTPGAKDSHV